jgi:hypothetical protein
VVEVLDLQVRLAHKDLLARLEPLDQLDLRDHKGQLVCKVLLDLMEVLKEVLE